VHAPVLFETSVPAVIEKLASLPPFDVLV